MIINLGSGWKIRRIKLILLVAAIWIGTFNLCGAQTVALPDVVVENGTVMLPVIYGNEQAVNGLLQYLQGMPEFSGMSMVLLEPKGAPAMVLLSGNDENGLRSAAQKVRGLLAEAGKPHRIVISAYLREMDVTNNLTAGIDWSSLTGNVAYGITQLNRVVDLSNGATKTDTVVHGLATPNGGYYGFNAQLNRSLSKSRVIMGSNLYTPNGMQGELLSQTIVPLQTTDSNGNSTLTSQTISSDVKITPTIVKYNPEKPSESVVKLDIFMEMALVTGTVQVGTSTAKEFSTKTLSTMGYVKADTQTYVVGVFAGDTETKSVNGIPILMNIPYLKYLFSQKTTQLTHKVGVLTVSVRILPEGY
jgi:type II secretory pathway component GspD/PulD (secretin)